MSDIATVSFRFELCVSRRRKGQRLIFLMDNGSIEGKMISASEGMSVQPILLADNRAVVRAPT